MHHQVLLPNCLYLFILPCCSMDMHPSFFVISLSNLPLEVSKILLCQPINYHGISLASCLSKLLGLCYFQVCFALPTCSLGSRGASLICTGLLKLVSSQHIHQGCKSLVCSVKHEQSIWLSRSWSTPLATFLSETYHVLLHVFCCSGTAANI